MAFTGIQKLAENIVGRQGSAFASEDGGQTWLDLGILGDITVDSEAINSEGDIANREKMLAADVTVNIVVKQTTVEEIGNLSNLAQVTGNGRSFKLTDKPATAATAASATGITFHNCFPSFGMALRYKGDSLQTISFKGRVALEQLNDLATTGELTFDA